MFSWGMTISPPMTVADRFALTLDGLGRAVAGRFMAGVMSAAMILLVWQRLRRVERRVLRLLARYRAGRLLPAPRRVAVGRREGRLARQKAGIVLPRRFGWLLAMVPGEAACFAGQLGAVMDEPEMVALMGAAPQMRRVLQPVCRMLGMKTPGLAVRRRRAEAALGDDRAAVVSAEIGGAAPVRGVSVVRRTGGRRLRRRLESGDGGGRPRCGPLFDTG